MENEQNEQQDTDAEATEDLEVTSEEAEGVAGGLRKSNPDARPLP